MIHIPNKLIAVMYPNMMNVRRLGADFSVPFCRAMLCKCGLCRHAVFVHPSVMFMDSTEMNKRNFKIFTPSGSHTILLFLDEMLWQYYDGDHPNVGHQMQVG